ncbi:heterokaryon incompatibility protein-domain-containing protein [Dactylonectria macrodidyma]|uniref:Heterokaryon incompatibility protein-domain-containing protein n=1 Tax=Dactylonectria macrodidyma TaxID=307937 RepID=A0A9P9IQD3_9HYPO|nr:heterokaryon incompatibility protein-domain-containing protein [Dactylonectria macrodidyma]
MASCSTRPPTADELSQLPAYQYDALREHEFRIVHLHPGTDADELVISVEVRATVTSPFNAVSYVWGETERAHRIYAANAIVTHEIKDGEKVVCVETEVPPSAYIMVTDNLRKVLRSIRRKELYVPLWIDSLCINQGDITEKSSQVKKMDIFYSNASSTLICLTGYEEMMPYIFEIIDALAAMKD